MSITLSATIAETRLGKGAEEQRGLTAVPPNGKNCPSHPKEENLLIPTDFRTADITE